MIEKGLLAELSAFHTTYNSSLLTQDVDKSHGDYTRGIFQCIGFKEFHSYLKLSPDEQASLKGQQTLTQGQTGVEQVLSWLSVCVRMQIFNQVLVYPSTAWCFDTGDVSKSYQFNGMQVEIYFGVCSILSQPAKLNKLAVKEGVYLLAVEVMFIYFNTET